MTRDFISRVIRAAAFAALAVICIAGTSFAGPRQQAKDKRAKKQGGQGLAEVKSGTLSTREGLRLRLVTDLGDVRILTVEPGASAVLYQVRLETDSRDAEAQVLLKQFSLSTTSNPAGVQLIGQVPWHGFHGRLWVRYEITVPRHYNLDVTTQVGNIETQDVDGRVSLVTLGGNISAGRIGGPEVTAPARLATSLGSPVAHLETQGGHITVQDVNGDLRAITAGGHINAGNIDGDAFLRTGGGNIRAGTIRGVAQLDTGGGNIAVQRGGSKVTASSAGGQIDFGEAAGSIRAHTAGGSIRVLRVSGPMQLASSSGSIFLPQVRGGVHASTGAGTITAWFVPEGSAYLRVTQAVGSSSGAVSPSPTIAPTAPRSGTPIAAPLSPGTAPVAVGSVPAPAPPGLPRKWKLVGASQLQAEQGDIIVYIPSDLAVTIEAVAEMGGDHRIEADPSIPMKFTYLYSGGNQTVKGECALNGGGDTLYLKTSSGTIHLKLADTVSRITLLKRQLAEVQQRLALDQARMLEQFKSMQALTLADQAQLEKQLAGQLKQMQEQQTKQAEELAREASHTSTWFWAWPELWSGVTSVDPDEQQKKLVYSVQPAYPDVLREGGLEGTVRLRIVIGPDGAVRKINVLSGNPRLAEAAISAVRQWRYQPALVDSKPVSVATTVSIQFKLE